MQEGLEKKYWETTTNAGLVKRLPTHPVVEFYCKQRIEYMKKFIDFESIKTALEVGAGTGFNSFYFPSNIEKVDLDFSLHLLRLNYIKNKIQASGYNLPFNSNSFDLVYCWNFLHHLHEPEKAVCEMARITKEYLVLFEPNRNNPIQFLFGLSNKHERGTLQFNKKKLLEFVKKIKFHLISCESVGWFFAGPTPTFCLKIFKQLPFVHRLGISNVVICKKQNSEYM